MEPANSACATSLQELSAEDALDAVPYLNPQTGMPIDDACEAVPYLSAETGRPVYESDPAGDATPSSTRSPALPYIQAEVQRVSALALPYLDPNAAVPYFEAMQSFSFQKAQDEASTPTDVSRSAEAEAVTSAHRSPNPMACSQSERTPTGGMDAGLREKLARQQTKQESGESSVDPLNSRRADHRLEVVDGKLAAKFAEQQEREQSGGEICRIEAGLTPRSVSPRAMDPQLAARLQRQRQLLEQGLEEPRDATN